MHARYWYRACFHRNPSVFEILTRSFLPQRTITLSFLRSFIWEQCLFQSTCHPSQPFLRKTNTGKRAGHALLMPRHFVDSNSATLRRVASGLHPTPRLPEPDPQGAARPLKRRKNSSLFESDLPQRDESVLTHVGRGKRKEYKVESFLSVKF